MTLALVLTHLKHVIPGRMKKKLFDRHLETYGIFVHNQEILEFGQTRNTQIDQGDLFAVDVPNRGGFGNHKMALSHEDGVGGFPTDLHNRVSDYAFLRIISKTDSGIE